MTKSIISWSKERDPDKVLVSTDKVSELLSEHEEEYYKILAIMSKMFDESSDLENIYIFFNLEEGVLTIERVCVNITLEVNSTIFSNNGLICRGD